MDTFRSNPRRIIHTKRLSNKWIAAESLEGLACVFAAEGASEQAAKLFGSAEAMRGAMGHQHTSEVVPLREPYLATARSRLDDAAWEAAFSEGQSMGLEEAVEYALSEEEPDVPLSPAPEQPSADEVPTLTRREEEIAALVARGMTNRHIAAGLSISEHTAATHIRRILKKLGFRSRAELAVWVSEQQPSPSDLD